MLEFIMRRCRGDTENNDNDDNVCFYLIQTLLTDGNHSTHHYEDVVYKDLPSLVKICDWRLQLLENILIDYGKK